MRRSSDGSASEQCKIALRPTVLEEPAPVRTAHPEGDVQILVFCECENLGSRGKQRKGTYASGAGGGGSGGYVEVNVPCTTGKSQSCRCRGRIQRTKP